MKIPTFFQSVAVWAFAVVTLFLGRVSLEAQGIDSTIVVSEIQYHPVSTNDTQWIELHCLSGVKIDLTGWSLGGSIKYAFPSGTVINGRGYLVVALNPGAASLVGGALGPFTGSLTNNSEIEVLNGNGRVMTMSVSRMTCHGRTPPTALAPLCRSVTLTPLIRAPPTGRGAPRRVELPVLRTSLQVPSSPISIPPSSSTKSARRDPASNSSWPI